MCICIRFFATLRADTFGAHDFTKMDTSRYASFVNNPLTNLTFREIYSHVLSGNNSRNEYTIFTCILPGMRGDQKSAALTHITFRGGK